MVCAEGYHFSYEDGKRYLPFGTTAYAWIYQPAERQEQTIKTLKNTCFNKIRMLVFPKFMPYNKEEPEHFPYERRMDGTWNVEEIDPIFWDNLDKRVQQLAEIGVEADLILFHPYDKWGFSRMSRQDSLTYLRYVIARYSAYPNVWWSLANEYEMLYEKNEEDWDLYGKTLQEDPDQHLRSIHQIVHIYPKRDWMTHMSIQTAEAMRIPEWKKEYGLPVIIDEFGYEGDIEYTWGNLTAEEVVHRFWVCIMRGGYATHGETFHREDQVLWWSKGGVLYGKSQPRIAWLRQLMESLPQAKDTFFEPKGNPNADDYKDDPEQLRQEQRFYELISHMDLHQRTTFYASSPYILHGQDYDMYYYGRTMPALAHIVIPDGKKASVEILDAWEMTRTEVEQEAVGEICIRLPAKELIAVLVTLK